MQRILVPLDGTARSEVALKIVETLSQKAPIDLFLLDVFDVDSAPLYSFDYLNRSAGVSRSGVSRLPQIAQSIRQDERFKTGMCEAIFEIGDPVLKISEVAEAYKIDLIVMASHGYTGLERFLLGSVTEGVMRRAICPVLAVKNGMIPTHFLVALDKSTPSETIIEPAIQLASRLDAKVTFTYIRTPEKMPSTQSLVELSRIDQEVFDLMMQDADAGEDYYLKKIIDDLARAYGLEFDYSVAYGRPIEKILNVALEDGCDLIAMNTEGRGWLERLTKGSVTASVFEKTSLPMLISHCS